MTDPWVKQLDALSSDGMATLLSLATSHEHVPSWLPVNSVAIERSRAILADLPMLAGGRPAVWLDEIAAPSTPLTKLVSIKRAAKELSGSATDERVRTAAILVYHGAIAAAFAHHSAVISSRPLGLRLGLYDGLGTALGSHPIAGVFRVAVERYLVPH